MSLCFCSILKPSFLNREFDSVSRHRLAPNPNSKPYQFCNLRIDDNDFCTIKAVHTDGVGVLYPDDTVSDRTTPVDAQPEDQVDAPADGIVGTAMEESHEAPIRTRVKKMEGKKANVEDSDKENRFTLRNGREVSFFLFNLQSYIMCCVFDIVLKMRKFGVSYSYTSFKY